MKNHNFNRAELNSITSKIWQIFDLFKGSIRNEDLDVVLFLLSAYNDGLIDNTFHFGDSKNQRFLNTIKHEEKYNSINKIYFPIVENIPADKIEVILNYLTDINTFKLQDNFAEIFETVLYRFSDSQSRVSGEFIQPLEVSRFIMNLADLRDNATVYNPFAGLASFAIFLNNKQRYYGQEINQRTWALGTLRLMAHNLYYSNYNLEDSVNYWNNFGEFDLIVANPPFESRPNRFTTDNSTVSFTNYIIENSLNQLPNNGQLICVLPQSFLYRSTQSNRHLRRFLVDNHFIDTVISLPTGVLKHTAVSICIVVFKKSPTYVNKIRLVDASEFAFTLYERKVKTLDDIRLLDSLKFDRQAEHIRYVDVSSIQNQNYDLNINRYFIEEKYNGERLESIAQYLHGSRSLTDTKIKHVRIRDLKDDIVNYLLDTAFIEKQEVSSQRILRKIEQDCLLVAIRWKTLKPTYFKYEGEPIYISNDIIALKIDENRVNINYLINELHADYVKDQLNRYRISGVVPLLRKDDLLSIKLELPSLENQSKKYYAVASDYIKSVVKESRYNFDEKKINFEDENSFLRHQIAGSLKNARGAFKFIQKILEDKVKPQFPDLYDLKVNEVLETTLGTYLNIVERDLNSITKSVNKIGDKIELMDLKVENFDLLEFLKDYEATLNIRSHNFYEFSMYLDENAIKEFGISAIHIEGDKDILRKMFDNIIENAEKHAFSRGIKNGNQIKIELIYNFENMEVQVDFCNTGNPLPENITYESMTRKGSSLGNNSGDGIGLWFAKEVMELHNGKFGFTDKSGPEGIDSEFVTSIELTFPIIPAI